jgi:hypothetical protein
MRISMSKAFTELEKAQSEKAREAVQDYINILKHLKYKYGPDTIDWPTEALDKILWAARNASDIMKAEKRREKLENNIGIKLNDF